LQLLGWKNLACQQQLQRATMIYKSLHEMVLDYVISKAEKQETEYNPWHSENMNSMFHYHAQSITKIALAMAAPFIGAVFLVM